MNMREVARLADYLSLENHEAANDWEGDVYHKHSAYTELPTVELFRCRPARTTLDGSRRLDVFVALQDCGYLFKEADV